MRGLQPIARRARRHLRLGGLHGVEDGAVSHIFHQHGIASIQGHRVLCVQRRRRGICRFCCGGCGRHRLLELAHGLRREIHRGYHNARPRLVGGFDPQIAQFGTKVEQFQPGGCSGHLHQLQELVNALRPVFGLQGQGLGDGIDKRRGVFLPELLAHCLGHPGERHHAIADGAQGGRQGCVVAQAAVHNGGKGVQIAPRPLDQIRVTVGILLDGRVIDLEHGRVLAVPVVDRMARSAQVQQYRRAEVLQKNVVGRDVAVQRLPTVQYAQRPQHTPQHLAQPGLWGRRAHLGACLLERHAAVQRHDHVSRVVVFPEAEHLDQRGMVELRQQARFPHERLQARMERREVCGRTRHQHAICPPGGQGGRHELLDGHGAVQGMVKRLVHHAKATHPQKGQDFEFPQARAHRQGIDMHCRWERCLGSEVGHGDKSRMPNLRASPRGFGATRLQAPSSPLCRAPPTTKRIW